MPFARQGHGRADRRFEDQLAADREDRVADRLGLEPLRAHPPDQRVVGVDLEALGVVRRARADRPG